MSAKTIAVVVIALSVAMGGAAAYGQEEYGFEKGDKILTLGGSGSSANDFDATTLALDLGVGWFISNDIAFAFRQGVSYDDSFSGSDWQGSTRLGLEYYILNPGQLQPFVGVNIGYIYGDNLEDQFITGANAGVLWFMNSTTFARVGIEYQFLFKDTDEVDDRYDDGRFVYALGLGVKL